jgi:hypothetical protein
MIRFLNWSRIFGQNIKQIFLVSCARAACFVALPTYPELQKGWSQWARGLTPGSAAVRLLRLWVQFTPGTWLFISSVMCRQVEVSATSWSPTQGCPTDCDASLCVIFRPREWGGHGLRWDAATKKMSKALDYDAKTAKRKPTLEILFPALLLLLLLLLKQEKR